MQVNYRVKWTSTTLKEKRKIQATKWKIYRLKAGVYGSWHSVFTRLSVTLLKVRYVAKELQYACYCMSLCFWQQLASPIYSSPSLSVFYNPSIPKSVTRLKQASWFAIPSYILESKTGNRAIAAEMRTRISSLGEITWWSQHEFCSLWYYMWLWHLQNLN